MLSFICPFYMCLFNRHDWLQKMTILNKEDALSFQFTNLIVDVTCVYVCVIAYMYDEHICRTGDTYGD